jgi:hypothetical protein
MADSNWFDPQVIVSIATGLGGLAGVLNHDRKAKGAQEKKTADLVVSSVQSLQKIVAANTLEIGGLSAKLQHFEGEMRQLRIDLHHSDDRHAVLIPRLEEVKSIQTKFLEALKAQAIKIQELGGGSHTKLKIPGGKQGG